MVEWPISVFVRCQLLFHGYQFAFCAVGFSSFASLPRDPIGRVASQALLTAWLTGNVVAVALHLPLFASVARLAGPRGRGQFLSDGIAVLGRLFSEDLEFLVARAGIVAR
jgi:hypothetical protein